MSKFVLKLTQPVLWLLLALCALGDPLFGQIPRASDLRKARELFYQAKAARDDQRWYEAYLTYGRILESASQGPYLEESCFWRAFCLQKLGRSEEAAAAYEDYLNRYPNGKFAAVAAARTRALLRELSDQQRQKVRKLLQQMRKESERQARRGAVQALSRSATFNDVPVLIDLLEQEEDPSLRVVLITTLGRTQLPEVVPYLVSVAETDTNRRVRTAAISALGRVRSRAAYLELAQLAQRVQEAEVRKAAVQALTQGQWPEAVSLLTMLSRTDASTLVRRAAVQGLASFRRSPSVVDSLYTLAASEALPADVKYSAIRALRAAASSRGTSLNRDRVLRLVDLAESSGDPELFVSTLELAREVPPGVWRQISPRLFEELSPQRDTETNIRVLSLFRHKGLGSVEAQRFVALLRDFAEPEIQAGILGVLGRYSPSLAEQGLRTIIEEERPAVQLYDLVNAAGPQACLPVLEEELRSPDPGWREIVVEAVGRLAVREPQALPILIRTAENDPESSVRLKAFLQLSQSPQPEAKAAVRRLMKKLFR